MKITKIHAVNFKGQTFSENLTDKTLFIGKNFKGKSARTDAIRLALLGFLPELGKENKATFALSSGAHMGVRVEFDTGDVIERTWTLKGNSITKSEVVPEQFKDVDLAVMLNSDAYFSLSDQKRIEYVFGLVDMAGVWTPVGIAQRVLDKVPTMAHAQEGQISLLDSLNNLPGVTTVQAWVDAALAKVTETYKTAAADVKRKEATIQQLTASRSADETHPIALPTLQALRTTLTAEIAKLNERKGADMAAFTAMKSARVRREVIEREMRFMESHKKDLARWLERQRLAKEQLELLPLHSRADIAGINQQINECVRVVSTHASNCRYATAEQQEAEQELAKIAEQAVCPYCGATGEAWKEFRSGELAQKIEAKKGVATAEGKHRDDFAAARDKLAESRDAILAQIEKRDLVNATLVEANAEIQDAQNKIARVDLLAEELKTLAVEDASLTTRVESVQSEINIQAAELRSVEAGIQAYAGREQEKKRMAQAESDRDEALKEKEMAAAVGKELKAIQAQMVESAFAPLLEYANSFFADILNGRLSYNVNTQEIGVWRGAAWVSHHTMSGTEKALIYAAIQAALSGNSPCRIMIIDELGRLDAHSLGLLLIAAENAIARGLINQFFGVIPGSPAFLPVEAFQVIEIK